jgi:hypothetical protein
LTLNRLTPAATRLDAELLNPRGHAGLVLDGMEVGFLFRRSLPKHDLEVGKFIFAGSKGDTDAGSTE